MYIARVDPIKVFPKKKSHRFRWLKEIYGGTEQQLHINYTFIEDLN